MAIESFDELFEYLRDDLEATSLSLFLYFNEEGASVEFYAERKDGSVIEFDKFDRLSSQNRGLSLSQAAKLLADRVMEVSE